MFAESFSGEHNFPEVDHSPSSPENGHEETSVYSARNLFLKGTTPGRKPNKRNNQCRNWNITYPQKT